MFTATLPESDSFINFISIGAGYGIDPSKLATSLIQDTPWSGPWLACYMLRRFGWPNIGSDDHKELMSWMLTTPMEGVFLGVSPRMSQDDRLRRDQPSAIDCLHFRVGFSLATEKKISESTPEIKRVQKARISRIQQWWKEKGRDHLILMACSPEEGMKLRYEYGPDQQRRDRIWGLYDIPADLSLLNFEDSTTESKMARNRMPLPTEIAASLAMVCSLPPDEENSLTLESMGIPVGEWPEPNPEIRAAEVEEHQRTIIDPINDALLAALRDLLIPTHVRDMYFNAQGSVEMVDDIPSYPPHPCAGYTPEYWFEHDPAAN